MRLILPIVAIALTAGGVYAADALDRPVEMDPGLWQFEGQLQKFTTTGIPARYTGEVKAALLGDYLVSPPARCISHEEAKEAFTRAALSRTVFFGKQCKYSKWDIGGGNVDVEGSCRSSQGEPSGLFSAKGTVGPDKVDLVIAFNVTSPSSEGEIQSEVRLTGQRAGPCDTPSQDTFAAKPSRADVEAAAAAMQTASPEQAPHAADVQSNSDEAMNAAASMMPDFAK